MNSLTRLLTDLLAVFVVWFVVALVLVSQGMGMFELVVLYGGLVVALGVVIRRSRQRDRSAR